VRCQRKGGRGLHRESRWRSLGGCPTEMGGSVLEMGRKGRGGKVTERIPREKTPVNFRRDTNAGILFWFIDSCLLACLFARLARQLIADGDGQRRGCCCLVIWWGLCGCGWMAGGLPHT